MARKRKGGEVSDFEARMDEVGKIVRSVIAMLEADFIVDGCQGDVDNCASCRSVNARRELRALLELFDGVM